MTWVIRIPKRSDFCGCPPCPLCYNWATDAPAGRVQDKWVQEIIDGMSKFKDDMLGGKTPTANENEVLNAAAEAIHVGNLSFGQRVDAEFKAADKAQHTERQMDDFLAKKRADAARPPPVEPKACLDDMDLSKLNEPPPKPNRQTAAWMTAMDPAAMAATFYGRGPSFTSIFMDDMVQTINREMGNVMGMDLAPPPLDDKQRREIQAKEDAKKKMKAQSRGYAKVGSK